MQQSSVYRWLGDPTLFLLIAVLMCTSVLGIVIECLLTYNFDLFQWSPDKSSVFGSTAEDGILMGMESYFYCHVLIIVRGCVKKINTICLDCISKIFFFLVFLRCVDNFSYLNRLISFSHYFCCFYQILRRGVLGLITGSFKFGMI